MVSQGAPAPADVTRKRCTGEEGEEPCEQVTTQVVNRAINVRDTGDGGFESFQDNPEGLTFEACAFQRTITVCGVSITLDPSPAGTTLTGTEGHDRTWTAQVTATNASPVRADDTDLGWSVTESSSCTQGTPTPPPPPPPPPATCPPGQTGTPPNCVSATPPPPPPPPPPSTTCRNVDHLASCTGCNTASGKMTERVCTDSNGVTTRTTLSDTRTCTPIAKQCTTENNAASCAANEDASGKQVVNVCTDCQGGVTRTVISDNRKCEPRQNPNPPPPSNTCQCWKCSYSDEGHCTGGYVCYSYNIMDCDQGIDDGESGN